MYLSNNVHQKLDYICHHTSIHTPLSAVCYTGFIHCLFTGTVIQVIWSCIWLCIKTKTSVNTFALFIPSVLFGWYKTKIQWHILCLPLFPLCLQNVSQTQYIHWHCSLGYFTYLKAIKSRKMLSRSSTYIDFRTYNTVKSSILFTYFHRNISYHLLLIPQNIYIQWLRYLGYLISSNWDIYQNSLRLHWKYLRSDKSNNICFTFKSEITKTAINSTNIYHISKLAHSATQYFVCIILHIINTKISTTLTQVKQYLTHIKSRISNDCVIYV